MPNYSGMHDRWAAGGESRGNREGALAAERKQQRFSGGEACPRGCGSIIAYEVGVDPQKSVRRHTSSSKACVKHPGNTKSRGK